MPRYYVNQFLVESTLLLPCSSVRLPDPRPHWMEKLNVCHEHSLCSEFPYAHLIGRRAGGSFLRAYDVGDSLLIHAGNAVVKMAIRNQGERIVLDFDPDSAYAGHLACALTINLGVSLCSLLRGYVMLHGTGVTVNGKYIGIMAPSGTGKSTLLWRLLDQGARFANDDIISVRIDGDHVLAIPSISLPAKLSKQALADRGLNTCQFQEVLPGEEEFWIPIDPENRLLEPQPLHVLFVLRPFEGPKLPDQIFARRVYGGAATALLMENTQGIWAAYSKLDAARLIAQYTTLAQAVPVYVLEYHRCFEALPALLRILHEKIADHEGTPTYRKWK